MTRADSPLAGRMIFVFGARRSGTYWLQRILGGHPDVAGIPSETHLFSHGIAPLVERFHQVSPETPGLGSVYMDREELFEGLREFCDRVFAAQLRSTDARFLLERTPLHSQHARLIAEIYPDARFVHIIRDGRDAARSMIDSGWPGGPATIEEAAREWRSSVVGGCALRGEAGYIELRYESLLEDPRREITRLFELLGLRFDSQVIEAALAIAAVPVNVDPKRAQIGTEKWRRALSAAEQRRFEAVAGELLGELGYPPGTVEPRPRSRLRSAARGAASRAIGWARRRRG